MGRLILLMLALTFSWWARGDAATYSCVLSPDQETILAEELAFRQVTITHQQALQRLVNREMTQLGKEQDERLIQDFNNMARITTSTAQDNAEAALAAGITAPTLTPIGNQTHNVAQAVTIPLVATNPYPNDLALTWRTTGLPPGINFSTDANGNPQLAGKPTTAGTFPVTVAVYNVTAKQTTETLTWIVNP